MIKQTKLLSWYKAPVTEAEFEAFYLSECPRLFNFFRFRCGDDQSAEDLTALTFEKAWRNRSRYKRNLAAFSTWLFTIARRVAVDHFRRQRSDVPLEQFELVSGNEALEDRAQDLADFARLSSLLARLADRERELVALKYGAGLTNRAIAALSGLTETHVGVILHRALQFLREEWEAHS